MSETKKFLDFGGLQALWGKMKSTFASRSEFESLFSRIGTAETNITNLGIEIDGVEELTLSYAPKIANKYSDALARVNSVSAGQIFVVGNEETIDDVTYKEGFYIVDNNKSLHYVGTTVGGSDSEIAAIRERLSTLEGKIINSANIVDENGQHISGITLANNSLVMVYDNEVIPNSESVHALTHRAVAAKFAQIEGIISNVPKFKIEIVDELPTNAWSLSTIYLVKNSNEQSNNLYTEYIYVEDKGWEKLGEQTISLDNYVTKEFLNTSINNAISGFIKSGEVENMISAAKQEVLNTVSINYATKAENANKMTEADIITSIKEGAIGEAITITNDQINSLN